LVKTAVVVLPQKPQLLSHPQQRTQLPLVVLAPIASLATLHPLLVGLVEVLTQTEIAAAQVVAQEARRVLSALVVLVRPTRGILVALARFVARFLMAVAVVVLARQVATVLVELAERAERVSRRQLRVVL
jgi:hypothetical protein